VLRDINIKLLNLPVFLTIEKDITENLFIQLEKKFENIREEKVIIFTSTGIYNRFIDNLKSYKMRHQTVIYC